MLCCKHGLWQLWSYEANCVVKCCCLIWDPCKTHKPEVHIVATGLWRVQCGRWLTQWVLNNIYVGIPLVLVRFHSEQNTRTLLGQSECWVFSWYPIFRNGPKNHQCIRTYIWNQCHLIPGMSLCSLSSSCATVVSWKWFWCKLLLSDVCLYCLCRIFTPFLYVPWDSTSKMPHWRALCGVCHFRVTTVSVWRWIGTVVVWWTRHWFGHHLWCDKQMY